MLPPKMCETVQFMSQMRWDMLKRYASRGTPGTLKKYVYYGSYQTNLKTLQTTSWLRKMTEREKNFFHGIPHEAHLGKPKKMQDYW